MSAKKRRVAYVMTHYPFPAQTFIAREIFEVERGDVDVERIAINRCEPSHRVTATDDAEAARTFHVKSLSPTQLLLRCLQVIRRHPIIATRAFVRALRPVVSDPRLARLRVNHFVAALIVADRCVRQRVDHIHAQFGGMPATVAMVAAHLTSEITGRRVPWSFTIHGYHDFLNERDTALAEKAADAACVVCVSDYFRAQVLRITPPAQWPNVRVVRVGIPLSDFPRRVLHTETEVPTVVCVGRLSAEKGQVQLLHAAATLRDDGIRTALRFVGDGPDRAALESEANRLAINATFTGPLTPTAVRRELETATVFCLPSFAEGIPVSLMEAMAIGVPIVTTHVSGIPELVIDSITGRLVPASRVDLLAAALREVLGDSGLRDKLATAARDRVVEFHDSAQTGIEMRAVFADAAT